MSDNKIPYEELIIRYLDGDATEEETAQLQHWVAVSPENKLEFDQMQALFLLSGDIDHADEIDVEADLKSVKSRLNSKPEAKSRSLAYSILKIAASVILLTAVAFVFYLNSPSSSDRLVTLSDGTKVYLRDDATIDFPETFNQDKRYVSLHGEAYFEVSHDKSRPFIVEAADTEIKVLGTTFLIKEEMDLVEVMVQSGKVEFAAKDKSLDKIILTANEHGMYQDSKLTEQENENKNYLSWHTGHFEFKDTKLIDILEELSTYYPKMILGNSASGDCQLTATFENENLKTIVKVIETSCDVKAVKTGEVLVFN